MSKLNGKKISKKNQLHDFLDYDIENVVFSDPVETAIPNSNPPVKFQRIYILGKNAKLNADGDPVFTEPVMENGVVVEEPKMVMDDSIGDLLVTLDKCFSFGVSESTDPQTQKVTGHSISLCMYSKDGATDREVKTVDKFQALIEKCKDHVYSVRKTIKQPKLERTDLKSMDKLLYWKLDEDGERTPGIGPTVSPKLIETKASVDSKGKEKPYKMETVFYLDGEVDDEGNPVEVDPLSYLSDSVNKKYKLCNVRPLLKIDSIYISGAKISIQLKITEADISPVESGNKRLLHGRHKIKENNNVIFNSSSVNPLLSSMESSSSNESSGASSSSVTSEKNHEEELKDEDVPEAQEETPVKKKVVKKVTKKSE